MEGHYIEGLAPANVEKVPNLVEHLPAFADAMSIDTPEASVQIPPIIEEWHRRGRKRVPKYASWLQPHALAQGAYGTVFRIPIGKDTLQSLDALFRAGTHRTLGTPVSPDAKDILVKIQIKHASDRTFVKSSIREGVVHKTLSEHPPIPIDGCRDLQPAAVVPKMHAMFRYVQPQTPAFHGVHPGDVTQDLWITYMVALPPTAKTVGDHDTWSARQYVALEWSIASVWAAGFLHSDLHTDNMLYDPRTGVMYIIDFGFAVYAGELHTNLIREELSLAVRGGVRSLGELWRKRDRDHPHGLDLHRAVDKVQLKRDVRRWGVRDSTFYNPDGHVVLMLYNGLPPGARRLVPRLRLRMWGVSREDVTELLRESDRHTTTIGQVDEDYEARRSRKLKALHAAQAASIPTPGWAALVQGLKKSSPLRS